jgi:hypothetical protein
MAEMQAAKFLRNKCAYACNAGQNRIGLDESQDNPTHAPPTLLSKFFELNPWHVVVFLHLVRYFFYVEMLGEHSSHFNGQAKKGHHIMPGFRK